MDLWASTQHVGQKDRRKRREGQLAQGERAERNKGRALWFDSMDAFLSSVFTPTTQVHPYMVESLTYNASSSLTASFPCCSTGTKCLLVTVLRTPSHLAATLFYEKWQLSIANREAFPSDGYNAISLKWVQEGRCLKLKLEKRPGLVIGNSFDSLVACFWNKRCFRLELPGDMKMLPVKCVISKAVYGNLWGRWDYSDGYGSGEHENAT